MKKDSIATIKDQLKSFGGMLDEVSVLIVARNTDMNSSGRKYLTFLHNIKDRTKRLHEYAEILYNKQQFLRNEVQVFNKVYKKATIEIDSQITDEKIKKNELIEQFKIVNKNYINRKEKNEHYQKKIINKETELRQINPIIIIKSPNTHNKNLRSQLKSLSIQTDQLDGKIKKKSKEIRSIASIRIELDDVTSISNHLIKKLNKYKPLYKQHSKIIQKIELEKQKLRHNIQSLKKNQISLDKVNELILELHEKDSYLEQADSTIREYHAFNNENHLLQTMLNQVKLNLQMQSKEEKRLKMKLKSIEAKMKIEHNSKIYEEQFDVYFEQHDSKTNDEETLILGQITSKRDESLIIENTLLSKISMLRSKDYVSMKNCQDEVSKSQTHRDQQIFEELKKNQDENSKLKQLIEEWYMKIAVLEAEKMRLEKKMKQSHTIIQNISCSKSEIKKAKAKSLKSSAIYINKKLEHAIKKKTYKLKEKKQDLENKYDTLGYYMKKYIKSSYDPQIEYENNYNIIGTTMKLDAICESIKLYINFIKKKTNRYFGMPFSHQVSKKHELKEY